MVKRKRSLLEASHSLLGKWLSRAQSSASKKYKASREAVRSQGFLLWNSFHESPESADGKKHHSSQSSDSSVYTPTTEESHDSSCSDSRETTDEKTHALPQKDYKSCKSRLFLDHVKVSNDSRKQPPEHPSGTVPSVTTASQTLHSEQTQTNAFLVDTKNPTFSSCESDTVEVIDLTTPVDPLVRAESLSNGLPLPTAVALSDFDSRRLPAQPSAQTASPPDCGYPSVQREPTGITSLTEDPRDTAKSSKNQPAAGATATMQIELSSKPTLTALHARNPSDLSGTAFQEQTSAAPKCHLRPSRFPPHSPGVPQRVCIETSVTTKAITTLSVRCDTSTDDSSSSSSLQRKPDSLTEGPQVANTVPAVCQDSKPSASTRPAGENLSESARDLSGALAKKKAKSPPVVIDVDRITRIPSPEGIMDPAANQASLSDHGSKKMPPVLRMSRKAKQRALARKSRSHPSSQFKHIPERTAASGKHSSVVGLGGKVDETSLLLSLREVDLSKYSTDAHGRRQGSSVSRSIAMKNVPGWTPPGTKDKSDSESVNSEDSEVHFLRVVPSPHVVGSSASIGLMSCVSMQGNAEPCLELSARASNFSTPPASPRASVLTVNKDSRKVPKVAPSPQAKRANLFATWQRDEVEATPYYSLEEFKQIWEAAEDDFGLSTEEIEDGNLVRQANSRICAKDSQVQTKAQYGRILPDAMQKVFREIMDLQETDVFVDIGHGIGNTVLQASLTFGCESRGIEVVNTRNYIAETFAKNIQEQRKIHKARDRRETKVGKVRFCHGRLEEPKYRSFLTECNKETDTTKKGTIKALANNFNGVFAERCAKANQSYYLDHYISGLFASMKPGSVLVTLHPLLDLPPSLDTITENRRRHKLPTGKDASFYELEKCSIGKAKDSVSWSFGGGNKKNMIVYRYTRVQQSTDDAVFLCSNPQCPNSVSEEPIPATKIIEVEGEERIVVNHCDCNISDKSLRQRRKIDYTHCGY